MAVHEDGPVGEGVVVAHNVRQVGVLLLAHVGEHHAVAMHGTRRRLGRRAPPATLPGGARAGVYRELLSRLPVHSAHRGKGVGPADVLGVPCDHHLRVQRVQSIS